MSEGLKKLNLGSTHKEKINFLNNNGIISFESKGKLAVFNGIIINLKEYVVTFDEDTLFYDGISDIKSSDNAFQSKWAGHGWKLIYPVGMDAYRDIKNLTAKHYSFMIGMLDKTKKRFIKIKALEMEKGIKTVDYQLVIEF